MHLRTLILRIAIFTISSAHAQVKSDSYAIRYCGTGPDSHNATLQTLLPIFRRNLQLVQADAKKGTDSKAFRAFFRTQSNAPYVCEVFKRMADGLPTPVPGDVAHIQFENPNLFCIDPSMPGYEALRKTCGDASLAITRRNRALVVLCDPFWELKEGLQDDDCPVVRRNIFVQNQDDRVLCNQFAALVHQMAHAYMGNWVQEDRETKGVMECVRLGAAESVKNVRNLAFYAANRYPNGLATDSLEIVFISLLSQWLWQPVTITRTPAASVDEHQRIELSHMAEPPKVSIAGLVLIDESGEAIHSSDDIAGANGIHQDDGE
ncbi:MAG: hypothetical protein Q9169_002983 [Polycauliona sp. 2 TL-2023]